MGYAKRANEICNERDLIRTAIGSSCYIVPIMHWFLNNIDAERNLRIVQSEMMFKYPDKHVTRILCWVRDDCQGLDVEKEWNVGERWRASDRAATSDIDDVLKQRLNQDLNICHIALEHFMESYPMLNVDNIDLSDWK